MLIFISPPYFFHSLDLFNRKMYSFFLICFTYSFIYTNMDYCVCTYIILWVIIQYYRYSFVHISSFFHRDLLHSSIYCLSYMPLFFLLLILSFLESQDAPNLSCTCAALALGLVISPGRTVFFYW